MDFDIWRSDLCPDFQSWCYGLIGNYLPPVYMLNTWCLGGRAVWGGRSGFLWEEGRLCLLISGTFPLSRVYPAIFSMQNADAKGLQASLPPCMASLSCHSVQFYT